MSRRGWFLFILVGFLWGIPYLFIKVAVDPDDGFSPATVVFLRTAIGAAILIPIAIKQRQLIAAVRGWRYRFRDGGDARRLCRPAGLEGRAPVHARHRPADGLELASGHRRNFAGRSIHLQCHGPEFCQYRRPGAWQHPCNLAILRDLCHADLSRARWPSAAH